MSGRDLGRLAPVGTACCRIAVQAGVSHQRVSAGTLPFGPFRSPTDPVDAWVDARPAGRSIGSIAREYSVSVDRVSAATKPHGPFPYPAGEPAELLGTTAMGRWMGVAVPTVKRWQSKPDFPAPVTLPGTDRLVWDRAAVQAWADRYLTVCPVYAAQVLHVPRHRDVRRH